MLKTCKSCQFFNIFYNFSAVNSLYSNVSNSIASGSTKTLETAVFE